MATAFTDTAVNVSSSNNGHTYHIMMYAVVIKQALMHMATVLMATAVVHTPTTRFSNSKCKYT